MIFWWRPARIADRNVGLARREIENCIHTQDIKLKARVRGASLAAEARAIVSQMHWYAVMRNGPPTAPARTVASTSAKVSKPSPTTEKAAHPPPSA